jgi:hypothetical protein
VSLRERVRGRQQAPGADDRHEVPTQRRRGDRRLLIVAVAAVVALIAAGALAAVSTSSITVPVPVTETTLGELACPAPGRCVAVGSTGSRYTIRVPFSLRSADGTWGTGSPVAPLENGDSFLLSIACRSDSHCVAVGGQDVPAPYFGAKSGGTRPLVEISDGDTWRLQRSSVPPGTTDAQLAGVDCAGSTCMAVGGFATKSGNDRVMTQLWNGSSWKLILPPRPRTMQDPNLSGVSCVSATSCTAVGQYTYELGFGSLVAPLILRWNGTEWRFQPSGRLGKAQDTMLNSVDCPSAQVCVAIGSQRIARAGYRSFAEVGHAGAWRVTPTQDPAHSPDADLVSVDCPSVTRCVAVGYAVAGASPEPFVEWWNGARWTMGAAPQVPGASGSALSGVSCTSPDSCIAVGNFRHASPTEHAFTASWDGKRWTTVLAPDTAG